MSFLGLEYYYREGQKEYFEKMDLAVVKMCAMAEWSALS